jgi:alkylation response protein AidB-like acyl-CoA dehydrogenase
MEFGLSSEQKLLSETVRRFVEQQVPLDRVRQIAAERSGFDQAIWQGLADLGVLGIIVPEEYGGAGLSFFDAALVQEHLGWAVTPAPYSSTALMAPLAIMLGGSDAQRLAWLPKLASGEATAAVAISQSVERRDGAGVAARDGRLDGTALFVLDAADADLFVVADTTGALHLGRSRRGRSHADPVDDHRQDPVGRRASTDGSQGRSVARRRNRDDPTDHRRRGRIMLAADILGAGTAMIEQAVAYAGTRVQFGRPIGSFQAVKHMCAEMAAALEPCRSLVWYAAHAFDHAPDEASLMACHAKSHLSEVGRFVARTSTEVHGGMGFTDLAGLHFWFKRIGLDRQLLGGPELVRNEAARLQGWIAA